MFIRESEVKQHHQQKQENVCFQIGRSVEYLSLGCFHDRNNTPVIPSLESISATYLNGPYQTRENAVKKCALETAKVGFKAFALQDGGACLSGPFAHVNYSIYGETECPPGGKGRPNVSEVYLLGGKFVFCIFTIFYYSKASPYYFFLGEGASVRGLQAFKCPLDIDRLWKIECLQSKEGTSSLVFKLLPPKQV